MRVRQIQKEEGTDMTRTVRDYETNVALAGVASAPLREASDATLNGAVAAHEEGGKWVLVREDEIAWHRSQGHDVRTVYVD